MPVDGVVGKKRQHESCVDPLFDLNAAVMISLCFAGREKKHAWRIGRWITAVAALRFAFPGHQICVRRETVVG